MRSAPTLNNWMTPFSSVAMLEKLALLKIAFCKAPALRRASSRRTSVTILMAGGLPSEIVGFCITVLPVLFAQNALETSRYFGQNDWFGKKGKFSDQPASGLYLSFRYGRRQEYDRHVLQFWIRSKTGGHFAA